MSCFRDDYRAKLISQEELVGQLKPGNLVILGTWLGQPPGILRALGRYGRHIDPLYVSLSPTVEAGEVLHEPHIRCLSSFMGASRTQRGSSRSCQGRVHAAAVHRRTPMGSRESAP